MGSTTSLQQNEHALEGGGVDEDIDKFINELTKLDERELQITRLDFVLCRLQLHRNALQAFNDYNTEPIIRNLQLLTRVSAKRVLIGVQPPQSEISREELLEWINNAIRTCVQNVDPRERA